MGFQASDLGAAREGRLCAGQHQRRERRHVRSAAGRIRQEIQRQQGRNAKDEPSQVQQGGRHGRIDLPQRSLCSVQHQGSLLFRPDLCKSIKALSISRCFLSVAFGQIYLSVIVLVIGGYFLAQICLG